MARKENNRTYLTESELNNMISETVSLLLEGRTAKWDYDSCYQEAKKYTSRSEFQRNNQRAYEVARKNNWLDDYTWFERPTHKKWDYASCYQEAKKYTTLNEFRSNASGAYWVARKNDWLNDYTWLERLQPTIKNIYIVYCYKDEGTNTVYVGLTNNLRIRDLQHRRGKIKHGERRYDVLYKYYEIIGQPIPQPIILKENLYANEAQYFERYYVEYFKKEGWNLLNIAKAGSLGALYKWTEEKCYEEAKKYKSRGEFQMNARGAYEVARKNNWLDNYTWFERPYAHNKKWDYDSCYQAAKKFTSRWEFQMNAKGAYKVACKNDWLKDYTWFERPYAHNKKWDYDSCYQAAKKYTTLNEFRSNASGAYKVARKNGWLKDYTWLVVRNKWDRDSCYDEAKKYTSLLEFIRNARVAYEVARKNDWLKNYVWLEKKMGKWDYDSCYQEAKKYKSRFEFKRNAGRAYEVARKNGWLNDYTWFNKPANKKTKKISLNELKSVIKNEVGNLLKELRSKNL